MTTVGMLGTGMVGKTSRRALAELGADVLVGARSADSGSLAPSGDLDVMMMTVWIR